MKMWKLDSETEWGVEGERENREEEEEKLEES